MHKTILVPLDGSRFAEHALPAALAVARRCGATLRLLTVSAPLVDGTMEGIVFTPGELEAELASRCQEYLDDVAARVRALADGPVAADLAQGEVAEMVCGQIAKTGADLVVLATHGRGATQRFWLGSTTDEVIRRAETPLLLVRPGEGEADLSAQPRLSPALVSLDGSAHAEQILEHALCLLASGPQPEIVLFRAIPPVAAVAHAVPDVPEARREAGSLLARVRQMQAGLREQAEAYLEGVAASLRARGVQARTRVLVGDQPAQAILDEAKAIGAGLIALETHGRSGLSWMFLSRGVADKIVRSACVPVLLHRRPA